MNTISSLYEKNFKDVKEAIDYCRKLTRHNGFRVRIRTSKAKAIYFVCSKEGQPDPKPDLIQSSNTTTRRRNRSSDRCGCGWKVILYCNEDGTWEFRECKEAKHNHPIFFNNLNSKELSKNLENNKENISTMISLPSLSNIVSPISINNYSSNFNSNLSSNPHPYSSSYYFNYQPHHYFNDSTGYSSSSSIDSIESNRMKNNLSNQFNGSSSHFKDLPEILKDTSSKYSTKLPNISFIINHD